MTSLFKVDKDSNLTKVEMNVDLIKVLLRHAEDNEDKKMVIMRGFTDNG
jgi:hypothetical protein